MIKKITVLENVKWFSFMPTDDHSLLLIKNNSLELFDISSLQPKTVVKHSPDSAFILYDTILEQKENGKGFGIYELEKQIMDVEGAYYLWKRCLYDDTLYISGKNNGEKVVYAFDTKKLEIKLSPLKFLPTKATSNGLLLYSKGRLLECTDLSANIKWQLDVGEIGKHLSEGKEELGHINEIEMVEESQTLVVSIFARTIIGMDVMTGEIKWKKPVPGGLSNLYIHNEQVYIMSYAIAPTYIVLNALTGETIIEIDLGKAWESIAAIDPLSGKKTYFHWRLTSHTVDDKYMYITNRYDLEICIVDKNTAEIVERVPLEGGATVPALNAPIVKNNYLYQLDGNKNLFVFEIMG